MQKSEKKPYQNIHVLICLALLAALQIVMTRIFKINLGFARFNLGSVATIMAGLWFGPVCGALTGGVADLLGSFLQGYAPNPVIMIAAMLWGVIPAMLFARASSGTRRAGCIRISLSIILSAIVCTVVLNTAGLVLFYGYDIRTILPARLLQCLVMTPVYCLLACSLYYSPVTTYIRQTVLGGKTAS